MTNLKKVGLTALAGSLVAVSAQAGSLSVSGGAEISYTGMETNQTDSRNQLNNNGNRFGIERFVSVNGSGELDNGHTVSIYHGGPFGAFSSSALTYDMGDMGSLTYQNSTGDLGIGKIDDLMPSAYEEPWDGIDFDSGNASGSGVSGRVDGGQTGFNYATTLGMASINIGYAPKTTNDFRGDDGQFSGVGASEAIAAANPSSTSISISADVMDGLMVFGGIGDKGRDSATEEFEDEHSTFGLKYTVGGITAGYQHSEIDDGAAGSTAADTETDAFGVAFAINENLTVSYGYQETEQSTGRTDQELTGYAIGYSAGGMSIKAQRNEGDDAVTSGSTAVEVERTEILVGFAF